MFVVFGIEYWAGNPNFSCCSLITSSGNEFCVLLHPEGSLSSPQVPWAWHSPVRESIWSFRRDLPNPIGNLGAPGIPFWWLFWKPPHVSVLFVHSISHGTPGRITTPVIVSEWPCAFRQPKSYLKKYLHTSRRNSNSSCFNNLFPKSMMILPFLSKCFLDSIPFWLSFIVKSWFWFLSLIFHSHS